MTGAQPSLQWSAADAIAAEISSGADRNDQRGPFWQWLALQANERERTAYEETGDSLRLMRALVRCCRYGLAPPEWVNTAIITAYRAVFNHQVRTWDEALGAPVPKGAHLGALQQHRRLKFEVFMRVERQRRPGAGIGDDLFESVGKEFHIGKTQTSDLYYEAKATLESGTAFEGLAVFDEPLDRL